MSTDVFHDEELVSVDVSREADVVVVRVTGELDMSTLEPVERAVWQELAADPRGLVVDMRDVTFCGSTGLRLLVQARQRATSTRAGFRVVTAMNPTVSRVLEISGLDTVFEQCESVSDAVRELTAAA
ncbi:STAS domain-containing protein [Kibdelosporangium phytohabitans]|nr:STAS domain-containing protein [Kibdelosporangium phytohabitans]MBE1461668.1 anti-anti-sigma factor [Kibdelosporangium phytohabitans]